MPKRKMDYEALSVAKHGKDPVTGRFLPGHTYSNQGKTAYVLDIAPALIAEIQETGQLSATCEKYNVSPGALLQARKKLPELDEACKQADLIKAFNFETKLDDIIEHPENYDKALTRPSWSNLIMFRMKKLMPEYRDSTKIELTQNIVTLSEVDAIAQTVWEQKQQKKALPAPAQDIVDGEIKELA